jgi:hypothetical protein
MITNYHSRLGIACVALALGVGCGRPARAPSPTPATSLNCDQGYAVTVNNQTDYDVDVYASAGPITDWDPYAPPSPGSELIGTVTAHTSSELSFARSSVVYWRWIREPTPRPRSQNVRLHVHCR